MHHTNLNDFNKKSKLSGFSLRMTVNTLPARVTNARKQVRDL